MDANAHKAPFLSKGVRSLKNSYFEPRYILLIPINKDKYEGHLRRTGLFSRPEIEEAVHRVDMYIRVNQDFPGFFDAVINVGELVPSVQGIHFPGCRQWNLFVGRSRGSGSYDDYKAIP